MTHVSTSTWRGASGKEYRFTDYTPDTSFNDAVRGNYIFSRRDGDTLYPVYIGEGILKDRIAFRINGGNVQEKGCNCISVRLLDAGEDSKQIETDLLAAYPNSYEPTGCNKKEGG